jgi:thiosulfate/3-mercaptopyruvate sulfurtransferase
MKFSTHFSIMTAVTAILATSLLFGCGSSSENAPSVAGSSPSAAGSAKTVANFVSTDSLASQPGTLIVDVRAFGSYSTGHIPGAIRNTISLNSATPTATGVAGTLGLTQAEFVNLADKLGITPNTKVIAYDTDNSSSVGRFVWTLLRYGHTNVAVLDGGYQKWVKEGRQTLTKSNTTLPIPNTTSYIVGSTANIDVDAFYVLAHINTAGTVIWDSRTPAEYLGTDIKTNPRGGHIPGAVNLDWTNLQQKDGNGIWVLKSSTDILDLLKQSGITPDKEIIVHCQAGVRSAYASDVLLGLGFTNVKNYTGSWGEWSAAKNADGTYKFPISTGTNP